MIEKGDLVSYLGYVWEVDFVSPKGHYLSLFREGKTLIAQPNMVVLLGSGLV